MSYILINQILNISILFRWVCIRFMIETVGRPSDILNLESFTEYGPLDS